MPRAGRTKAGKFARAAVLIPLSWQKYHTILDCSWHYCNSMSSVFVTPRCTILRSQACIWHWTFLPYCFWTLGVPLPSPIFLSVALRLQNLLSFQMRVELLIWSLAFWIWGCKRSMKSWCTAERKQARNSNIQLSTRLNSLWHVSERLLQRSALPWERWVAVFYFPLWGWRRTCFLLPSFL